MLRSWKPLWSLISLLFPSQWMPSRAHLTTNSLLHKYKKRKSHSLLVLQKNSVSRKSGQIVHRNTGIFESLASTTRWSKLYMTVKWLGLHILLSFSVSLSILSLSFAGVNSFLSFLTMNRTPTWFHMRKSPWGLCRPTEDWGYCLLGHDDARTVEYTTVSHRALLFCVVISSTGVFQRTGEKSLFSKRLKIFDLMYLLKHRAQVLKHCQKIYVKLSCLMLYQLRTEVSAALKYKAKHNLYVLMS